MITTPLRIALLAALAAAGCGTKNLGSKLQPKDPSASEALGAGKCTDVGAVASPYVVDLRGAERSHLEAAMAEGVTVVHYDCGGLKLVRGCKVSDTDERSYAYTGVSIKEDVVQLKNADELRANLPISAVNIEGELASGVSLDIAMMMVGRRATVLDTVTRQQLTGPGCAAATHFVRSAIVGAFAVEKGSVGRARVAAEVFGAGVGAKSEADRRIANRDGQPEDCKSAKPDQSAPPDQCRAAITLELYPIVAQAPVVAENEGGQANVAGGAGAPPPPPPSTCPAGMVRSAGKCTTPHGDAPHQCKSDAKDCRTQCDKGHGGSCYNLAGMYEFGREGLAKDPAAASELYERACADRRTAPPFACVQAANALRKRGQHDKADNLLLRACDDGSAPSCEHLGMALQMPPMSSGRKPDGKRGQALLDRACKLGSAMACSMLAQSLMQGSGGGTKDVPRALGMLDKGCSARRVGDCMSAAFAFRHGREVAKNPDKALWYEEKACDFGSLPICSQIGERWLLGKDGFQRDTAKARAAFEKGCPTPSPNGFAAVDRKSCDALFTMYTAGDATERDPVQGVAFLERACSVGQLCGKLATVLAEGSFGVAKDPARADQMLVKGCPEKSPVVDVDACLALGAKLAKKDKSAARALYKDKCTVNPFGSKALCTAYVKAGGKKKDLVDRQGKPIQF